jgi:hypothetical protein
MFNKIKAFKNNFMLWQFQLRLDNVAHVLTLRMKKPAPH